MLAHTLVIREKSINGKKKQEEKCKKKMGPKIIRGVHKLTRTPQLLEKQAKKESLVKKEEEGNTFSNNNEL